MAAENMTQVLDEAEVLMDDVESLLEDRISWISSNPKALVVIASLTGLAVGAVLGYQIASKRASTKWQAEADRQIEDVKNHYATVQEKPALADLAAAYSDEEVQADLVESVRIMTESGYTSYEKVAPTVDTPELPFDGMTVTEAIVEAASQDSARVRNVFESDNPDTFFDFEEELKRREETPDKPYVITQEEFNENDTDYVQATLTYYDGDDVLADQKDAPVDDVEMVVGHANLLRFGHGSGDPNIVYIRNNKLELDFELTFSAGKFAKEVLGFNDGELQHSHRRPMRKFRLYDE